MAHQPSQNKASHTQCHVTVPSYKHLTAKKCYTLSSPIPKRCDLFFNPEEMEPLNTSQIRLQSKSK